MRAKKNSKTQESQKDESPIEKQIQILTEAIQPRRMNKDMKNSILNVATNKIYQIRLIDQNDKNLINSGYGKKLTILPTLLYLVFTNKRLSVQISWSKNQVILKKNQNNQSNAQKYLPIQENFIQQSQNYAEQFLKEKKFQKLLELIDQKMKLYQQQLTRIRQGQVNKSKKVQIQCIQFNIIDQNLQDLQNTLKFVQMFYSVLGSLVKRYDILTKQMTVKISQKIQIIQSKHYEETMYKFGWYFWKLVFEIRSVTSIQVKVPNLRYFLNPLTLLLKYHLNQQKSQNQNQNKLDLNNQTESQLFTQIYRIDLEQIISNIGEQSTQFNLLVPLLKVLPNLKFFMFKIKMQQRSENPLCLNDSYQIFKTISQSNQLLQTLCLLAFQLNYHSNHTQKIQNQNLLENQHILQNNLQTLYEIDKNLMWLQKMQEACPYLSGVRLQFSKKTETQERRLSQTQRKQYNSLIMKTSQIMNVFFHRGMNNQTFFNTIKVLQAQGFDYETILGVLDKINPFAPL